MKKLETSLGGQDYNTDLTYFRWGKDAQTLIYDTKICGEGHRKKEACCFQED